MRRTHGFLLVLILVLLCAAGAAAEGPEDARVAGKHQWTRQFGTSGSDFGNAAAVNASGVYITGPVYYWVGSPDNTFRDVLLRAYDHAGNHRWTRRFGPSGWDFGKAVAVDSSGVYVVGETEGAFPGCINHGGTDVFVRKYDHNGTVLWTRQFGTTSDDSGQGVAVSTSGVYVTGYTTWPLPDEKRFVETFVRAYDHAGKHRWTRRFGTSTTDMYHSAWGRGVAADLSGVYVVGYNDGAFPGWANQGGYDVFVRKYDHNGKVRWTRQFGTGGNDIGSGVVVNASGVYIVANTGDDVLVRAYTQAGRHQWTRQFGTSDDDEGKGIAVNASGVYVTGETRGAFPGWVNQGRDDVFVRAYSHTGKHLWTRQFGTTSYDAGLGVAATPAALYVTGDTWETLPGQTSRGGIDAFVRKYATG
ncbi:MAG: hypothetical protein FJW79_04545 [Actinobacteria bacterium]|nr:hypothetical protein [Actinomycetota bacterium]